MGARSKARKRALDVLYEADLRSISPAVVLRDRMVGQDTPIPEYAVALVEGVEAHQARIDDLLTTYSEGWTLERMPVVDRNVLRIGVFELLWCDDIPDGVAVDEAVELVKSLSTDESPKFVNGLLGRLLELKPMLAR